MKTPDPTKAESSAPSKREFTGTDNPRHLRVIAVMLRRPISRQELDSVAGCANGPALVSDLRDLGLEVPCERIQFVDRDGKTCRPGVYHFNVDDRRNVRQWQAKGHQRGGAA
ncbi:MAG: hypothetical protein U1F04_08275 [Burkholderiaceae bacterium]|jgi:hypothetical protein